MSQIAHAAARQGPTDSPRGSGAAPAPAFFEPEMEMSFSDEAVTVLNELVLRTGCPPSELFRRAIALYKLAVDSWSEGKAIGVVVGEDQVELVVTPD